jgi:hypothetical protein
VAKVALGWLHWTEEQLLFSDMNSVLVGYQGMQDLLRAVFGGEKPEPPAPPPPQRPAPLPVPIIVNTPTEKLPKLTPAVFDRMFANVKGKPN